MIAQELQPLIAADPVGAGQRRDMRQRAVQQLGVLEAVADRGFQRTRRLRGRLRRAEAGSRRLAGGLRRRSGTGCLSDGSLAPHRTSVNSRVQRTVQGQRQISQARSPSATEKKMTCARPIRFWNGT